MLQRFAKFLNGMSRQDYWIFTITSALVAFVIGAVIIAPLLG